MDMNLAPVPTEMVVQPADLDTVQAVLLMVTTPIGIQGFFLTDDMAIQVGNQLAQRGKDARKANLMKSRLTVVERPAIVVPGSHESHPSNGGD